MAVTLELYSNEELNQMYCILPLMKAEKSYINQQLIALLFDMYSKHVAEVIVSNCLVDLYCHH